MSSINSDQQQNQEEPFLSSSEEQSESLKQLASSDNIRSSTSKDEIEPFQLNYKDQPKIKYTFIFFACQIWIGAWFTSSFPGILKNQLLDELKISQSQYQLFSIIPSAISIPLCFTGGVLLDFIGVRKAIIIYSCTILIGAITLTIGGSTNDLTIFLIGRVLTNTGAEVLAGSINALFSYWFSAKGLTLVLSVNLVCGRIGSILAGLILPRAYESAKDLYLPMLIGAIICAYSLCCAFVVVFIDYQADKRKIKLGNSTNKKQAQWPKLSDFKKFSLIYWIICQFIGVNYAFYFTIQNNLATILQNKFLLSNDNIGILVTMTNYLGFLGPFYAMFAERFPLTGPSFLFSSVLGFLATLTYLAAPQAEDKEFGIPIVAQILFGLMLMIFSVRIWPTITSVTQIDVLGTAFGNAYVFKNLYSMIVPFIVGSMLDKDIDSINNTLILFLIMASISCFLNVVMWIFDCKTDALKSKDLPAKVIKKLRRTTTYGMDVGV